MSRQIPSTRSDTKVKERVWEPSPYTVIDAPVSAWRMKFGIARPSFIRMRGP